MKEKLVATSFIVAVAAMSAAYGQTSSQVPFPASPSEVTQPATGVLMHPEYAKALARTAYVWGWPMVNMVNRRAAITQAPQPGRLNGVLPAAPRGRLAMLSDYIDPGQNFVTCPNQDVVYGLGFFSLDEEPVVIQVPDFGDRFWIYALYDARTDQFAQIGKPYATKPGFYLLAGPNWNGTVPAGITAVVRSSTELANVIPRVFMDDTKEDRGAIQAVIDQIVAYPLADFDGTMKTTDWSEAPAIPGPKSEGGGETAWVVPEKFFDQLGSVLDTVAPLPGEEALYAQFRALLPSTRPPRILLRQAGAGRGRGRDRARRDRALLGLAAQWTPRRQWLEPVGQQCAVPVSTYFNRTGTAKSNMFDNKPTETQYLYTDGDFVRGRAQRGAELTRSRSRRARSRRSTGSGRLRSTTSTISSIRTRSAAIRSGTKNKGLARYADGSLTLHVGAKSPGAAKEANWLPAPEGPFSLYIRAYWGKEPILDGSWQPPKIVAVK